MLQIKDVTKKYITGDYEQIALNGVSLTLRDNEFVAILGPSGSGKTTLLNIIGGLDHYDSGDLIINGISTKQYKDRDWDTYRNHMIGFVFQSYNLISHQSILANVELAMTLSGISASERRQRALDALDKVGLKEQSHKRPNQMSGGQMQRVAIARALVNEPDVILADEPTGALDSETSIQIMDILKEIAKDKLVVMVTHNPELAEEYANRIVRVKDGNIVSDTNPVAAADMAENGIRHKWTKLAFPVALGLSLNNLMTKKGRTFLTAFAGAIGIIGIALILALSNGVNQYIIDTENNMLASYPITLEQTTYNLSSLIEQRDAHFEEMKEGKEHEPGYVYSNNVVADTLNTTQSLMVQNDLGKFKVYMDEHIEEIKDSVMAVEYNYGIRPRIYRKVDGNVKPVSPGSIIHSSGSNARMLNMTFSAPWNALVSSERLREKQYELLAGEWPDSYDDIAVVLSQNEEISDYSLYTLGVMDPDKLDALVEAISNEEEYDDPDMTFTYDDLLGREYMVFAPYQMYSKSDEDIEIDGRKITAWIDKSDDMDYLQKIYSDGIPVRISCILKATEDADIYSGVAYDKQLALKLMENASESEIVKEQIDNPDINILTGEYYEEDEEEDESEEEDADKKDSKDGTDSKDKKDSKDSKDKKDDKKTSSLDLLNIGNKSSDMTALRDLMEQDRSERTIDPSAILADGTVLMNTSSKIVASESKVLMASYGADPSDGGADAPDGEGSGTGGSDAGTGSESGDGSGTGDGSDSGSGSDPGTGGGGGNEGDGGDTGDGEGGLPGDGEGGFPGFPGTGDGEGGELPMTVVVFVDCDGTPLTTPMPGIPGMPVTPPADPSRPSDANGRYIFVGWHNSQDNEFYFSSEIGPAKEGITVYTALYYIFNGTASSGGSPIMPGGGGLDIKDLIDSGLIDISDLMGSIDIGALIGNSFNPEAMIRQYMASLTPDQIASMMGVDLSKAFSFSEEDIKKMMAENGIDLSGDYLSLMLAQMSDSTPSTYADVLRALGYVTLDQPTSISLYPTDLEGKDAITGFIDEYNDQVENEADVMTYNDLIAALTDTLTSIVNAISYILIAFVAISLIVSSIMIAIITYISVLERTKEIGILRALGASKRDVSKIFNAETFIEGLISGVLGVVVSVALCIPISYIADNLIEGTFRASVPPIAGIILVVISVILTLIAGFFPSRIAAKKDPVLALRSE